MTKEGIFVKNKDENKDTVVHYFVRADDWFYTDNFRTIRKALNKYRGNEDLSLAAPIMLGRFKYD